MHLSLLVSLSTITQFFIPFLLLAGVINSLRQRFSSARILELIGVLTLLFVLLTSISFGPESIEIPIKAQVKGFWDRATIQMFLSGAGFLLFAIGFVLDRLFEVHQSK